MLVNPFVKIVPSNLTIQFDPTLKSSNILLKIYNLNGQILKKINLGSLNCTLNDYNYISVNIFDHNFTSGIYILSFELDDITVNKKITLIKWKPCIKI